MEDVAWELSFVILSSIIRLKKIYRTESKGPKVKGNQGQSAK